MSLLVPVVLTAIVVVVALAAFRYLTAAAPEEDVPLSPEADEFLASCTSYYNEHQPVFHATYIENTASYGADLERGVLRLETVTGPNIEFDIQVIGSQSTSDGTWEWAWNNPNVAEPLARESEKLKAIGEQYDLSYLNAGFVPIPDERVVGYLCRIAMKVAESPGIFIAEHGDLTAYLLVFDPRPVST